MFPPGAATVAVSPTGDVLATAALDIFGTSGFVDFWSLENRRKLHTVMGKSADSVGIAFDLAGTKLAVGRIDDRVALIDVAKGQTIRVFDTTFFSSNQVALSGDGRILVHASSGNQTAQVVHSSAQSLSSPAMQAIINAKRRVTAWNTQTGDVLFTEAADPESLEKVAISRDGRLLAAGGTRTFLWELSTHKLIRRFDLQCAAVAFSPDGQQLATFRRKNQDLTVLV